MNRRNLGGIVARRVFVGKHKESRGSERKFTINMHPPIYFRGVMEEVYINERWGGMFAFLPVGHMVVMFKHSSRHQLEWVHECWHTAMSLPCAHVKSFSKAACRTPASSRVTKVTGPSKFGALFQVPCLLFSELNSSLCEITFSSGLCLH